MKYIKPEMIDINVDTAGGDPCNQGWTNYSMGCTNGAGNSTTCNTGTFHYGPGPACQWGGQPQSGSCRWGWGGN